MMIRNYFTLWFIILGFQLLSAQSLELQDHFTYSNAIKISPIDFGRSYFEISYEKYFKDRTHSIILSPTIMLKENDYESFSGLQFMLNYRFYLSHFKKGVNKTLGAYNIGFYAGPYIAGTLYSKDFRWGYWDEKTQIYIESKNNLDIKAVETGLQMGVQFDITSRIIIDLYVGGGIRYASDTVDIPEGYENYYYSGNGVFDIEYTGVKPKLGLQVGFTF